VSGKAAVERVSLVNARLLSYRYWEQEAALGYIQERGEPKEAEAARTYT